MLYRSVEGFRQDLSYNQSVGNSSLKQIVTFVTLLIPLHVKVLISLLTVGGLPVVDPHSFYSSRLGRQMG